MPRLSGTSLWDTDQVVMKQLLETSKFALILRQLLEFIDYKYSSQYRPNVCHLSMFNACSGSEY